MKVVILCGGLETLFSEETEVLPTPMAPGGGWPMPSRIYWRNAQPSPPQNERD